MPVVTTPPSRGSHAIMSRMFETSASVVRGLTIANLATVPPSCTAGTTNAKSVTSSYRCTGGVYER